MKNSIFKGYAKKIIKSEAFISVLIVFVLAIGIIGTSYALYMDVDTDTDYELVEVGDLSIGFDNGDNTIKLENIYPMEDEYATNNDENDGKPSIFAFYIYNNGSLTTNYDIKLSTTNNNEVEPIYINYVICKDNALNCTDVKTLGKKEDNIELKENLNIITSTIYNDELSPKKDNEKTNPSAYYFIKLWINKDYKSDINKKIELKVVVDAKNASGSMDNKNTLVGKLLKNNTINNTIPDFSIGESKEVGLYKTEDNNGIAYYFRGNTSNNYLRLDNKLYRILSINGDKTVKIILNNTLNINSGIANDPLSNYIDSSLSKYLQSWYNDNVLSKDYIYYNDWCNDNSLYNNDELVLEDKKEELLNNKINLKYISKTRVDNNKPTLKCLNTFKSNVSLLTIDEIVFSGSTITSPNKTFITDIINNNLDLISLSEIKDINGIYTNTNYALTKDGEITENKVTDIAEVVPALVIKQNVLASGKGTIDEPYVVK